MEYLISGILLGLSGGLSPGPLTALVMAQSIRHGPAEGAKAGLAPLVTDLPIVALAIGVLTGLRSIAPLLGGISVAGSFFLLYLAWECFTARDLEPAETPEAPRSLAKGVLTNLLNPSPYLFWFSVGAPLVLSASKSGPGAVALFFASFYLFLVGSKAGIALATGKARSLLTGRPYRWIMRALGLCLAGFAAWFFADGLGKLL
ncbi:MAG: LysE family transporter [Thermodesulfobacteriota bacterium]